MSIGVKLPTEDLEKFAAKQFLEMFIAKNFWQTPAD